MKYQDIADKYGVSINTVKSWKKRYAWKREKGAHKNEKGCTQNQFNIEDKKEPVAEEVKEVMENTELTEKQRLFCLYFTKYFNATKAYQKAYGANEYTAMVNGSRLLKNAKVAEEIGRLKAAKLNQAYLEPGDIFQRYMTIAFADMTDYMEWGTEDAPLYLQDGTPMLNESGEPVTQKINKVLFKDSSQVDGTLISEVKQGRGGVSIKLADRMRALDWIAEHMYMATPEQKARVELLVAQKEKLLQGADKNDAEIQQKQNNMAEILKQIKQIQEAEVYE